MLGIKKNFGTVISVDEEMDVDSLDIDDKDPNDLTFSALLEESVGLRSSRDRMIRSVTNSEPSSICILFIYYLPDLNLHLIQLLGKSGCDRISGDKRLLTNKYLSPQVVRFGDLLELRLGPPRNSRRELCSFNFIE